jgi:hypothetical protein
LLTNSGDILAVWDGKSLNEVGTEINKQIAKTKETYNL